MVVVVVDPSGLVVVVVVVVVMTQGALSSSTEKFDSTLLPANAKLPSSPKLHNKINFFIIN